MRVRPIMMAHAITEPVGHADEGKEAHRVRFLKPCESEAACSGVPA